MTRKGYTLMDIDDETEDTSPETGSDELLAADDLRLPEGASILVRLHAVRAWLTRREQEANIEVGEAVLDLQQAMLYEPSEIRARSLPRQEEQEKLHHVRRAQQALTEAQERLSAFEEVQNLLEEYIAHTSGERVLVEYYLALEELVQSNTLPEAPEQAELPPRLQVFAEVMQRVERVCVPDVDM